MTELSKEDQKWILFNQKMGARSGRKKTTIDQMWELLQEAHNEAFSDDQKLI